MVETTAKRDGSEWIVTGEKWHVTSGDVAEFFLLHTHVDGDPAKARIFLLDKDAPGVRLVRTPAYMHTFVFEHPIFAF
jgi:alkylation response protein AidB-like acyl-CoA dehydrogenase